MGADVFPGDIPKQYHPRRYYTCDDVKLHDKAHDCWVSYFGNVYDLTTLLAQHKDPLARPIITAAGTDISHWFDEKTRAPKKFIDPQTLCEEFYCPHGRYLHIPPTDPVEFALEETPWWAEGPTGKYYVGQLAASARKINIMNLLTKQTDLLIVPEEETVVEIQDRYLERNLHCKSYLWKRLGKPLDLQKTLEENGMKNETQEFVKLGMDPDNHIPTIHLYFEDDLTEN